MVERVMETPRTKIHCDQSTKVSTQESLLQKRIHGIIILNENADKTTTLANNITKI